MSRDTRDRLLWSCQAALAVGALALVVQGQPLRGAYLAAASLALLGLRFMEDK